MFAGQVTLEIEDIPQDEWPCESQNPRGAVAAIHEFKAKWFI